MVTIKWTDQSIQDIENISNFISKDSQKYARIQAQRFFDATEVLINYPEAGQPVPEVADQSIRQLLQGSYRIIYKIINIDTVHILTIHHSRRLLSNNPSFTIE